MLYVAVAYRPPLVAGNKQSKHPTLRIGQQAERIAQKKAEKAEKAEKGEKTPDLLEVPWWLMAESCIMQGLSAQLGWKLDVFAVIVYFQADLTTSHVRGPEDSFGSS